MPRGSGITIRDRLIVWDAICKGIRSPSKIKDIFDDSDEREISTDSIQRIIKEYDDFKKFLPQYPLLIEDLTKLILPSNDISKSIKEIDEHNDKLAKCAEELVRRLKKYSEEWNENAKICDILVDQNDFNAIEFFNKKIARGLLTHLKQSIHQLKELDSWDDLEVGDISEPFLNLISLKVALKEFEGRCDSCP